MTSVVKSGQQPGNNSLPVTNDCCAGDEERILKCVIFAQNIRNYRYLPRTVAGNKCRQHPQTAGTRFPRNWLTTCWQPCWQHAGVNRTCCQHSSLLPKSCQLRIYSKCAITLIMLIIFWTIENKIFNKIIFVVNKNVSNFGVNTLKYFDVLRGRGGGEEKFGVGIDSLLSSRIFAI